MSGTIADIILTGDRRFQRAVDRLIRVDEGGYANHPNDRGGATKYGISLRFLVAEGQIDRDDDGFADYDLDMDGDIDGADIRALSTDDAIRLYHRCFWTRLNCTSFPAPLGEMMFDQAVNGGASAARKMLQKAIMRCAPDRQLLIDGRIGPETRKALDSVLQRPGLGLPVLIVAYREEAKRRYREIVASNPSQKPFLAGWLARADRLGRD